MDWDHLLVKPRDAGVTVLLITWWLLQHTGEEAVTAAHVGCEGFS